MTLLYLRDALVGTWLPWFLVHSLWQVTLIALVLKGLSGIFPVRRARLRYRLSFCGLLGIVILPVVTAMVTAPAAVPSRVAWTLFFLTAIWSFGVLVTFLRLGCRYRHLYATRRVGVHLATDPLQLALLQLGRRMGLHRPVWLVETEANTVPMVLGWFRPVIVVPIQTQAALQPTQLQAVLAHELAHVKRHDHLVNALQNLVTAALFFHPGVHFVSQQLRTTREHCCDDDAVSACGGDIFEYVAALLRLERSRSSNLTLGVDGTPLAGRVERLLGTPQQAERTWWQQGYLVALGVLVIALGFLTLSAQDRWRSQDVHQPETLHGQAQLLPFGMRYNPVLSEPQPPQHAPFKFDLPSSLVLDTPSDSTFGARLFISRVVLDPVTVERFDQAGPRAQAELLLTLPDSGDTTPLRIPLALPPTF